MSPRPRSATDGGAPGDAGTASAGERFARALAAKDADALCALLADQVDFQALTPGRHWQAGTAGQAVREIILARWFGEGDDITELCSVAAGRVLDREHVAYRVRVRRSDRDHLVEQQAYYRLRDDRICYLRVVCSGYRPLEG